MHPNFKNILYRKFSNKKYFCKSLSLALCFVQKIVNKKILKINDFSKLLFYKIILDKINNKMGPLPKEPSDKKDLPNAEGGF